MQSVDESVCFVEFPTQARSLASHHTSDPSACLLAFLFGRLQSLGDFVYLDIQGLEQLSGLCCVGVFDHFSVLPVRLLPRGECKSTMSLTRG